MVRAVSTIILLAFLSSCEEIFNKPIIYEIPHDPDRISIDAKLTAGDSVFALLGVSAYSMGNYDPVSDSNFTVNLYENSRFIEQLLPDKLYRSGFFSGSYKLKPGNSYKIEAERNGYEKALGEAFLKEPVEIISSNIDTISWRAYITIEFQDPNTKNDYYYFHISRHATFMPLDAAIEIFESSVDLDEFTEGNISHGNNGKTGYLSDRYFNGGKKKIKIMTANYFLKDSTNPAYFYLHRISEDYYLYEKSKAAYDRAGDNEIFSEPVQIHSNIVNGYGIVAGATPTRIVLTP